MKFTYTLTTDEDQVLLDMINFFDDMGLPDHIDSKAYDSLILAFPSLNDFTSDPCKTIPASKNSLKK